jgi:uncharacterized protein YggE
MLRSNRLGTALVMAGMATSVWLFPSASQASPALQVSPEASSATQTFQLDLPALLAQYSTPGTTVVSNQRSLTVTGTGQVSVPADQALLQLFYYPIVPVETTLPVPSAPIDPNELQFVVNALTELGIPASDIQVFADPNSYGGAKIQLTLAQPTTDRLNQIVSRVNQVVAEDERFSPSGSSVVYTIDQCSAAENDARRAAMADVQTRASDFAEIAGVEIGQVLTLTDYSSWNLGYSTSCPSTTNLSPAPFQYGGYPFDPTVPPVVNVTTQVTATYAIED